MIPLSVDRLPQSSTTFKILRASLWHDRFWITCSAAVVFSLALAGAAMIAPLYRADSSLLVLLGSEYTYRTSAGENTINAGSLSRDQILRTEIEILQQDDLHREVINSIGVGTLYPELFGPPDFMARVKAGFKDIYDRLALRADLVSPAASQLADVNEAALLQFDANIGFLAIRDGNAIEITFTHRDPVLATKALVLLEEKFLRRRRDLYLTQEGALVGREVDLIRVQMEAADAKLAQFKKDRHIADYAVRRGILLLQQGALETDLRLARSQIEQNTARVSQLDQQIRNFPGVYNTLTNPLMLQVQQERSKAQAELQSGKALANQNTASLADVTTSLTRINDDEQVIDQLTRTRDVLVDNYKAASKVRGDRELSDNVALHRQDSVRVLQEPRTPSRPLPTRMMIASAGAALSIMVAMVVGLLLHAFRGVYLLPEAVESDTGLRVLISVPNSRRLAKSQPLIGLR